MNVIRVKGMLPPRFPVDQNDTRLVLQVQCILLSVYKTWESFIDQEYYVSLYDLVLISHLKTY